MFRALLATLLLIPAAAGGAEDGGRGFLVRTWSSEDGLPGNVARSLSQARDGSLWIATAEGICRFDGYEFTTLEDGDIEKSQELGPFRIFTPEDGGVWVSSYKGSLYRAGKSGFERIQIPETGARTGVITRLFSHQGMVYFHYIDRIWGVRNHEAFEVREIPPDLARAIGEDAREQTLRGRSEVHSEAPTRLVDRSGGVWSIESGMLFHQAAGADAPEGPVEGLGSDLGASDMLEDREGNLWITSPAKGLVRVRPRRVFPFPAPGGIYDRTVHTALRTRDGTWWIANRLGGIDRIRNGVIDRIEIEAAGGIRAVGCIYEDGKGRLWFATRDASVYEYNRTTGRAEARFSRTPELSKVSAIAEDRDGNLWFAGLRGLCRWNGGPVETFADDERLSGTAFETITLGPEGKLHAGTQDGRVLEISGDDFRFLGGPGDLEHATVSSVVATGPGELWASTIGRGLHLWNGGRWHRFSTPDGLPDERLTALTLVDGETLWMGSLRGIVRVSRGDLLARARGERTPIRWWRFDQSDGMPTRECTGGGQPGVVRGADGVLWFPTHAGLAGVDPARQSAPAPPPLLHLDSVRINDVEPEVFREPLVAGPGRVRLWFHFTGVQLSAPEKTIYRVQLAGLDEASRTIGTSREVEYPHVPPGRYTFRITATNGHGVSSLPVALPIVIRPHFWQTAWFLAFSILSGTLCALGIGWIAARIRMRKRIRELHLRSALENERSRISRDLHDDLGASLTELSILSELAAEDPDDKSLRPSLDQLSEKAKHVVGSLDEIVWATSPNQDSLRSLVEYIAFFAREFLKVVHVRLHSDVVRNVPETSIGPRRRHSMVLATREALNNAVKHARPESISLRIRIEDGSLLVRIEDDGPGFETGGPTSGDGLRNLRQRMTDCGGDCVIESSPGAGTVVTLSLPLPTAST